MQKHSTFFFSSSKLRFKCILSLGLAFFLDSALVQAFPAKFAIGPDNNQELVLSTLRSAQKTLEINVYQLDHPVMVAAILERISAGVTVNILVEGHPVGGISAAGKNALMQFKDAILKKNAQNSSGSQSHLYLMTAKNKMDRRYRFDHAKYIIADREKTLISSENLTLGGHANPGHKGSRGWDILLEQPTLTKELSEIFTTDITFRADVLDMTENTKFQIRTGPPKTGSPEAGAPLASLSNTQIGNGDVKNAALITSPDSLGGLVEMIRSAKISIEAEEMSIPLTWQVGEARVIEQNPILTALIEASRRGVQVKLLLNDDSVFSNNGPSKMVDSTTNDTPSKSSAPKNEQTRQFLQKLGFCEKLPISSAIIDVNRAGITYIHNKGFIIDGQKVLISSINGTHNSVTNNREVAVLVESVQAANYFHSAFQTDWKNALVKIEVGYDCSN